MHVRSGNERLPYAYVFINRKIYGSADSTGCARIPQRMLRDGDTLSASYVGVRDAFTVYRGGDSCTLEMSDTGIASVTILPPNTDIRKNIRRRPLRDFYQLFAGSYAIGPEDTVQRATGHFEYWIVPDKEKAYDIRLEMTPDPDASAIDSTETAFSEWFVNSAAVNPSLSKGVSTNRGIRIIYEGRNSGGSDVYTVIRPAMCMISEFLDEQSKFYIDPATKELLRIISITFLKHIKIESDTEYAVKDGKGYIYPTAIHAQVIFDDGRKIHYDYTGLTFDPKPDKKLKDKSHVAER